MATRAGCLEWFTILPIANGVEESLRRSEEFTRRILESNKDCIKVLDLEGRLLYMNDSGQALMEIEDFSSLVCTDWIDLWRGEESTLAKNALEVALGGGVGKFDGYCVPLKVRRNIGKSSSRHLRC